MRLSSQQGFSRRRAESADMRRSEHCSLAVYSVAGKKFGGFGIRHADALTARQPRVDRSVGGGPLVDGMDPMVANEGDVNTQTWIFYSFDHPAIEPPCRMAKRRHHSFFAIVPAIRTQRGRHCSRPARTSRWLASPMAAAENPIHIHDSRSCRRLAQWSRDALRASPPLRALSFGRAERRESDVERLLQTPPRRIYSDL